MKERVRGLLSRGVVGSGLAALGRRTGDRDGSYVLYGHRVIEGDEGYLHGLKPSWFEEQLTYLTRHYEVIPLNLLVECLERGRRVPPRTVVLTFDDGFRDNAETVLPLLARFGVPATFFVVTNSLSSGEMPWSQRLGFLFQHTTQHELRHAATGPEAISLRDPQRRRAAYDLVKSSISNLPRQERDPIIEDVAERLGIDPPRDRMMTWSHAREALAQGHEIGAHTASHALLARVPKAEAEREMQLSRDAVREQLGLERPHFCFPAGSIDSGVLRIARDIGFRSAFLPRQRTRLNQLGVVDAFTMSRVGLPNAPAAVLEAELDGPFHAIRRTLRGGGGAPTVHSPLDPSADERHPDASVSTHS